jgi:uncharacterized membrane protein YphA (DoxX/SURF4 family)
MTMNTTRTGEKVTWTIQILLALVFLFAGGEKFTMTDAELTQNMSALSPTFIRFIGVCELLGALGLVLPMALKVLPGLTPLAAAGLVIIMIGATIVSAMTMGIAYAIFPFVVGLLAIYVANARWPLLRRRSTSGQQFA